MNGLGVVWQIGAFIVAVALLVFVHEWGHFIAARLCGVKVLKFSVGFGRVLASWRFGRADTQWTLSAIPLGGYVKMLDGREGPVKVEESGQAFDRQPVVKRMLIVAAGPAANFLLAILLTWGIFIHGITDLRPMLGDAIAGSTAASAGIQAGETVRSIDGKPLGTWSELRLALLDAILEKRSFTLETIDRQGRIAERRFPVSILTAAKESEDPAREFGLQVYRVPLPPRVGTIMPGSPAERAGLQIGDLVVAIDRQPINVWNDVVTKVQQSPGRSLVVTVERNRRMWTTILVPEETDQAGARIGRIGVGVAQDAALRESMLVTTRYGLGPAFVKSMEQTLDSSRLTLVMLGKMIMGEISLRHLSGPVAIADYAGQSARLGIAPYLGFLALISVSIGLLNLLPIPVLDGGHLMYYLMEFIKGSPVSLRSQEIGQYIGLGVLGIMMTIAIVNDIHRLISG